MSRHRDIRNLDYNEIMEEDELSSSGDDKSPVGSASPTTESYLFHRDNRQVHSLSNFVVTKKTPKKKNDDSDLIEELLPKIIDVVGNAFTEKDITEKLRSNNYNEERTIDLLLKEIEKNNKKEEELKKNKQVDQFEMDMEDDEVLNARKQAIKPKKQAEKVKQATDPKAKVKPVSTPGKDEKRVLVIETPTSTPKKEDESIEKGIQAISIDDIKLKTSTDALKKEEGRAELRGSREMIKLSRQMTAARKKDIEAKIQQNTGKPHLNLVVIGHVDAGKSTIMGHLLYLTGNVNQRTMHKYEKESKEIGKGSFSFAWVLDEHEEERNRGITIDVAVNNFETEHKKITLLDAPGHRDFVPNMISGAAQADVAILIIDAIDFEKGFEADGQTKEHALLARSLGVQQLGVVINKLDLVDWSKDRFDNISTKLGAFLKTAGFNPKNIWYLPASGLNGVNLVERKEPKLNAWYSGPTLLQRIDEFQPATREINKPFRMCISDIYKSQFGLTVAGKIESGFVTTGDSLALIPLYKVCTAKSLRVHNEQVEYAMSGDNVDITLSGLEQNEVGLGHFLCDPENPIPMASRFRGQIITFTMPKPLLKGQIVELHYQNLNAASTVTALLSILDKSTGEVKKKNPRALPDGATATIELMTHHPICIEKYADIKQLGRFTLRESGRTIAAGIVTDLL